MFGKLLSSTCRPNFFSPTCVWYVSPKFNNWRGRISFSASHILTLLFWACHLAEDRFMGPPSTRGHHTYTEEELSLSGLSWCTETRCWAGLIWAVDGIFWGTQQTCSSLCSCTETSQLKVCSQGSLGRTERICREKNCSGTGSKTLLAVAEQPWLVPVKIISLVNRLQSSEN